MSIADKIARLTTAKTNIANAITNKGGTVSAGDGFEDFATDIASIPSGGSLKPIATITENGKYLSQNVIGATYDGTYFTQTDVSTTSILRYSFLYEITFKTGDDVDSEQWIFGVSCTTANEHLGLRIANGYLYCHSNYDMTSLGLTSTPIEANTVYNVLYDRNVSIGTTNREWVVNGTRIATIANRYRGYTDDTYLLLGANPQVTGSYFKGTIRAFELWINADGDYSRNNTKIRIAFDNYSIVNQITSKKFPVEDVEASGGYDGFESPIEIAVPLTKYGLSIDDMLGDVNASGVYQAPSDVTGTISFAGIKQLTSTNNMQYYFYSRRNLKCAISFPDLTTLQSSGLQYAFYYTLITSFSAPNYNLNLGSATSAFAFAFYQCTALVSANFTVSNLGASCLNSAFYGCTSLTTPPTINAANTAASCMTYTFYGCTALQSFTFPELLTANNSSAFSYCFYGCTGLKTVTFPKMTRIGTTGVFSYTFQGCNGGLSVYFTALTTLSSGATFSYTWRNANNAHIYFPALTEAGIGTSKTHFSNACYGATGITLHFPNDSAVQAKIEALTNYPNFNGSNTTVLFDL